MGAQELFGTAVTVLVCGVIFIAVRGGDPSWLIDLLPEIILGVFFVSLLIALVNNI